HGGRRIAGRLAAMLGVDALGVGFQRQGVRLDQLAATVALGFGIFGIVGFGLKVSLRLVDRRLIRTRIDDEQNVAGVHSLAVVKADFGDAPGVLRPDFGIIDRVY